MFINHDPGAGLLARLHRVPDIFGTTTDHSSWLLSNLELWIASTAISTYEAPLAFCFLSASCLSKAGDFLRSSYPILFQSSHLTCISVLKLPLGFIYDHFLISTEHRNPFVQQASWFEDVVIRCVRYAFAFIPASIGRVFFSKPVSLPFMRFRMLRHGYLRSPIKWREVKKVCTF